MGKLINNKGITLVALVITIVILLILAGVALELVIGNNGIINRAQESRSSTERYEIEEQLYMAITIAKQTAFDTKTSEDVVLANKNSFVEASLFDENTYKIDTYIYNITGKEIIIKVHKEGKKSYEFRIDTITQQITFID